MTRETSLARQLLRTGRTAGRGSLDGRIRFIALVCATAALTLACLVMAVPQAVVVILLLAWGAPWHAALVAALLAGQGLLMRRFLADPHGQAAWYNGTGTLLYVLGMLTAALALHGGAA